VNLSTEVKIGSNLEIGDFALKGVAISKWGLLNKIATNILIKFG
jgi:hypothetical protein